ncbi:TolC family protein [Lacinutrix algicola]|uniref:TolC family protein n=1 Tax=Lacinutrix algicola TaxID=342954 RepID=UPI000AED09EB
MKKKSIITIIILLLTFNIQAQNKPLTIHETLELALENNASLKAENLKINQANTLVRSAFTFDKTSIYYNYDESNLAINNKPLKVFGISQNFKFPTVYFAEKKLNESKVTIQETNYNLQLQQIKKQVYANYYQLSYAKNKAENYKYLDSLYQDFARKAERRFELGETNYLEMITAQSKQKQLETFYKQALQEVNLSKAHLTKVVQTDSITIANGLLEKLEIENLSVNQNIGLSVFDASINYRKAETKLEKQSLLPDIYAEYFQGTNASLNGNIKGYQLGFKIPILFGGQRSKIKASKIAKEVIVEQKQDYKAQLNAEHQSLLAKLQQYEEAITYYETQGQTLSEEIIKTANRTFKEGEIDFFQYIQSLETAKDIQLNYLEQLNQYNQTVITINYLIL